MSENKAQLPIYIEDFNMSAQYHNFLYSILMTDEQNISFFYQNYVSMLVKHMHQSHVDFAYDGLYACDRGPLRKFILRGPVQDIHEVIREGLAAGCYVVLNLNEYHLPHRDAYQKYYFRHDLLLYGYDAKQKKYMTVGLDDQYHYHAQEYSFTAVEDAYFHMNVEWDFEVFLFRKNTSWKHCFSREQFIRDIQMFSDGDNPNRAALETFLQEREGDTAYTNESYYAYYGMRIYDYLEKRLKRGVSILDNRNKEIDGGFRLGVTDTRSVQALLTQKKLLYDFLENDTYNPVRNKRREELLNLLTKIQTLLFQEKMLLLEVIFGGERKKGLHCLHQMQKLHELDREWMCSFLEYLRA